MNLDEQLENRLRFLRKASTEQMPHPSEVGLFDRIDAHWWEVWK